MHHTPHQDLQRGLPQGPQATAHAQPRPRRTWPTVQRAAAGVLAVLCLAGAAPSQAATPAELLAGYSAQATPAGTPADPARGQRFFNTNHGQEWRCASCHGAVPKQGGQHAATGKPIAPLAPAFNPERFTDPAKVEKWFGRNCNDVLRRACTPAEKADVLAWLMTIKP